MDDDLYLIPEGPGSRTTQRALHQEAEQAYEELGQEACFPAQTIIRAYEREFRALAQLQPRRKRASSRPVLPFQDIPTTPLARLTR